jgi:hypothetical protein
MYIYIDHMAILKQHMSQRDVVLATFSLRLDQ